MSDKIEIEILEDGTISFSTDKISDTNHANADQFLSELTDLLGGDVKITPKKDRKGHVHTHKHDHAHTHKH